MYPKEITCRVPFAPRPDRHSLGRKELSFWSPQKKKRVQEAADFHFWAGEDSAATLHSTFKGDPRAAAPTSAESRAAKNTQKCGTLAVDFPLRRVYEALIRRIHPRALRIEGSRLDHP